MAVLAMRIPYNNFEKGLRNPKSLTECFVWNCKTCCKGQDRDGSWMIQFLDNLFPQFIEGLRNSKHCQVACDSWKQGTSLTDLFMSIEDYDRKRHLFSAKALSRTASTFEYDSPTETEVENTEGEEEIGAVFQ